MCSRDCSTAMCWKWLILAGSVRLNTPPTPRPGRPRRSYLAVGEQLHLLQLLVQRHLRQQRVHSRSTGWRPGRLVASLAVRVPPPASTLAATTTTPSAATRLRRGCFTCFTTRLLSGGTRPPRSGDRTIAARPAAWLVGVTADAPLVPRIPMAAIDSSSWVSGSRISAS